QRREDFAFRAIAGGKQRPGGERTDGGPSLLPGFLPLLERTALLRSPRCSRAGLAEGPDQSRRRAIFQGPDPGRRGVRSSAKAIRTSDPSEAWETARAGRSAVPVGGKEPGAVWGSAARP